MAEHEKRGADRRRAKRSFLARLARDRRGNVLAVVGASLVPLLAMTGSGIDLTRAYMAQARLQQACDAAALAGRRVMTGGVVDKTVTDEATKFFNFNFPQATWNTAAFTPAITQGADSTVIVTAATTINTEIMRLFGFKTLPISVACNAKQDFVNTDIVLVLDTTGSMDDKAASTDTDTKIVALRKAVLALYDQLSSVQTKLESAGLRLRYGIVPFASSMNVGAAVMSVNPSYIISDNYTYQSRVGNYVHVETGKTTAYCTGKGGKTSNAVTVKGVTTYTCTYTDNTAAGGTLDNWTYKALSTPVASYVATLNADGTANGSIPTPSQGTPGSIPFNQTYTFNVPAASSSQWKGCIEERQTVNTITASSGYTIPSAANDLNIDLIPSDTASKWAPYWPEVEFRGDGNTQDPLQEAYYNKYGKLAYIAKPQFACPAPTKRLQSWTRSALSTYLDTLNPDGGTYHDNGMIWGARLLSRKGIFAADNPDTYLNMPFSRHIIYMTDGIIDTGATLYSTYGVEAWDQRVGGFTSDSSSWADDSDSNARHDQRFKMMCAATKQMGVSIWVIAFASALSDSLSGCATNAAQASTSANSAALTAKFVEIGKNIGALRLTQ